MKRRISIIVLAVILMFTSVNWNSIDANAIMLSDIMDAAENTDIYVADSDLNSIAFEDAEAEASSNESVDEINTEEVIADSTDLGINADEAISDNDALSEISDDSKIIIDALVWQKLLKIAEEYVDFEYEKYVAKEADNNDYFVIKAIEDDDNKVSFIAENDKEKLVLIVANNDDECEIIYSIKGNDVEIKAKQLIADIEDVILFENDVLISAETFSECKNDAEAFLQTAVVEWNDVFNSNISWSELGFDKWNKLCEKVMEESVDVDETIKEAELVDADNEDINILEEIDANEETLDNFEASLIDEDSIATDSDKENEVEILVEEDSVSEEMLESSPAPAPSVERIATNYDEIVMRVGEEIQLEAKVYPENSTISPVFGLDPVDSDALTMYGTGLLVANKQYSSKMEVVVQAGSIEKRIPVTIIPNDVSYDVDENGNSTTEIIDGEKFVIAKGIWVGGFEKSKTYTGKPVTQDLTVYYKGEKLTIKKDYKLSYKNNTNACSGDALNAPSVTITMTGKYSGKRTLYYEIKKAELKDAVIETDKTALVYNGKIQKYIPTVSFNGKKLVNNKDFVVAYLIDDWDELKGSPDSPVRIDYVLNGKGNFSDELGTTLTGSFYITPKEYNLSKATVTLNSTVKYDGTPVEKEDLNLKIKLPGSTEYINPLDFPANYDVEISPAGATSGTAKVIIDGAYGDVRGRITKTFKIVPAYNLATVTEVNTSFQETVNFYRNTDFNKQKYESSLLNIKGTSTNLVEGVDYVFSYSNINKLGTAKITFKGIGAYSGSITKAYQIVKNDFNLVVEPDKLPDITFGQGNNQQTFSVYNKVTDPNGDSYKDLLTANVDYTVKYINNTNVGSAQVVITFKGAYAGAEPITIDYVISSLDISKCSVTVPDKAYSAKANAYKSVPTIVAPNGKKLVAGKDYEKTYKYEYINCDENDAPKAGTKVTVSIIGKGNYFGTATGTYTIYDSKTKGLNKLYFSINDQVYTGKKVEPKLGTDIKIYTNATDFKAKTNAVSDPEKYVRIISYSKNINTGTGTVVFGASYDTDNYAYGGTRKVSFKIAKRNYDNNSVVSVFLDKTSVELVSTSSKATETLTAIIKSTNMEDSTKVDNPTIVWKSSNTNIVKVKADEYDITKCIISAEGKGTAVITCTTQDGNKVAKCTVNSIMKPIRSISRGKASLELTPGESAMLDVVYEPEDAYVEGVGVVYSSLNSNIATVDNTGKVTAVSPGMTTVVGQLNDKSLVYFVLVKDAGTISYIDVKSFGAKGDGITDDTMAFKEAISALKAEKNIAKRNLRIPPGKYIVNTVDNGQYTDHAINLENLTDAYINMEGAVISHNIDCHPENMRGVFTLDKTKNVIIEGGTIECNKEEPANHENYFGIMIVRSSDIQIKGVTILDSSADGIYLGKGDIDSINKNIYIKDCTVSGSVRNNIALVNALNVIIDNCSLKDGKAYMLDIEVGGLGLDIEPNTGDNQYVKNVYIKDCTFSGNRSDFGIHCHRSKGCNYTSDITLDGCSFDKKVYIQCGKNVKFINTVREPDTYYDGR